MLRPSRPLDRDRMSLLPREVAMTGATAALDGVQNDEPEAQVLAIATLFAGVCLRTGSNPEHLFEMGRRVLTPEPFHRGANTQGEALRDYVGLRIMGQEVTAS